MTSLAPLTEIANDLVGLASADMSCFSDADLLDVVAAWERVGRVVDAVRVLVAGEVGCRSRSELGDEGLSRSENFTSPSKLVSAVTGVSVREAGTRLELGRRLRGAVMLGGVVGPEPYPVVSVALAAGDLGVEAAAAITRECGVLAERGLEADAVAGAEQTLVHETVGRALTADQTAKLAIHLRELLDPDGAEPRDDRLQQQRSLTFTQSGDGMLRGKFALTPEQAGVWVGAIQALQSPRTTGPRFVSEDDYIAADTRTSAQKNVDTVTELITRASTAPDMPRLAGATTTVNVHVTLDDLETGRGVGWIDGITEPIPTSTIAQLRCTSPTVTTVFGDRGEVLHHGKTRRLFTPAQNRALAARDGGCVWPSCERPPSWCETHHVDEWVADDHPPGRTDIDNGVLLCHFHHSHLHKSSWKLTMQSGAPHLIPPRWIDTSQTPIPTTRRRTIHRPAA
jgi:hypothetical protein